MQSKNSDDRLSSTYNGSRDKNSPNPRIARRAYSFDDIIDDAVEFVSTTVTSIPQLRFSRASSYNSLHDIENQEQSDHSDSSSLLVTQAALHIDVECEEHVAISIETPNDSSTFHDKSSPFSSLVSLILNEIFMTGSMPAWKEYLLLQFISSRLKPLTLSNISIILLNSTMFFTDIVLRGIAQVFLCDHPISGLFICAGLALSSGFLLGYAILGTVFGTLGAFIIGQPSYDDITSGLCGYDGALVGCSCFVFLNDVSPSRVATIAVLLSFVSGYIHVACANILKTFGLPTFTLAFNLVMMSFLLAIKSGNSKIIAFGKVSDVDPAIYKEDYIVMSAGFMLDSSTRGVGQFMFVDTTVGSGLVIFGIGIASRVGALAAWSGATIACLVCYYLLEVPDLVGVRQGLFGYNSAGTCAAVAGGVFFMVGRMNFLTGATGAATAALLLMAFKAIFGELWGLPVLTFPFISTAYLILATRSKWLVAKTPPAVAPDVELWAFLCDIFSSPSQWLCSCSGGGPTGWGGGLTGWLQDPSKSRRPLLISTESEKSIDVGMLSDELSVRQQPLAHRNKFI